MSGFFSQTLSGITVQITSYVILALLLGLLVFFLIKNIGKWLRDAKNWIENKLGGSKNLGQDCNVDTDCKHWGSFGSGKDIKCCKGKCTKPACMTTAYTGAIPVAMCPTDFGVAGKKEGQTCSLNSDCEGYICAPGTGMPSLLCCSGICKKAKKDDFGTSCPGKANGGTCSSDSDCSGGNCKPKTYCGWGFTRYGNKACCNFINGKPDKTNCSETICTWS